jgi:hypothetical protein
MNSFGEQAIAPDSIWRHHDLRDRGLQPPSYLEDHPRLYPSLSASPRRACCEIQTFCVSDAGRVLRSSSRVPVLLVERCRPLPMNLILYVFYGMSVVFCGLQKSFVWSKPMP